MWANDDRARHGRWRGEFRPGGQRGGTWLRAWGVVQGPVPAPVNMPGAGLTMLGSVDGGDACADGSCAIAIVDPAG